MPTLTERFVADIEGLSDLPSLSPVLAHLIATLDREDASVAEVAAIIRQDPVIAARVLRAQLGCLYRPQLGVVDPRRAPPSEPGSHPTASPGSEPLRRRARPRHAGFPRDLLAAQPGRGPSLGDHRPPRDRCPRGSKS